MGAFLVRTITWLGSFKAASTSQTNGGVGVTLREVVNGTVYRPVCTVLARALPSAPPQEVDPFVNACNLLRAIGCSIVSDDIAHLTHSIHSTVMDQTTVAHHTFLCHNILERLAAVLCGVEDVMLVVASFARVAQSQQEVFQFDAEDAIVCWINHVCDVATHTTPLREQQDAALALGVGHIQDLHTDLVPTKHLAFVMCFLFPDCFHPSEVQNDAEGDGTSAAETNWYIITEGCRRLQVCVPYSSPVEWGESREDERWLRLAFVSLVFFNATLFVRSGGQYKEQAIAMPPDLTPAPAVPNDSAPQGEPQHTPHADAPDSAGAKERGHEPRPDKAKEGKAKEGKGKTKHKEKEKEQDKDREDKEKEKEKAGGSAVRVAAAEAPVSPISVRMSGQGGVRVAVNLRELKEQKKRLQSALGASKGDGDGERVVDQAPLQSPASPQRHAPIAKEPASPERRSDHAEGVDEKEEQGEGKGTKKKEKRSKKEKKAKRMTWPGPGAQVRKAAGNRAQVLADGEAGDAGEAVPDDDHHNHNDHHNHGHDHSGEMEGRRGSGEGIQPEDAHSRPRQSHKAQRHGQDDRPEPQQGGDRAASAKEARSGKRAGGAGSRVVAPHGANRQDAGLPAAQERVFQERHNQFAAALCGLDNAALVGMLRQFDFKQLVDVIEAEGLTGADIDELSFTQLLFLVHEIAMQGAK